MSVHVKFDLAKLQKHVKGIAKKYPKAANEAARASGFLIQSIVIKDYLSKQDGIAVTRLGRKRKDGSRGKGVKPTRRTTWPGLRRRTGTLARNIRIGLIKPGGSLQMINSEGAKVPDKLLEGVAVGVDPRVQYGEIQEREGRKQAGRNATGRNYYPFLAPAFKDAARQIKTIFLQAFLKASRMK